MAINDIKWGTARSNKNIVLDIKKLPTFDPPKNDSEKTKEELRYLKSLPGPTLFDIDNDVNFSNTFADYLKSKGKKISEDDIKKYSKKIQSIVIDLKNHYNRPRPHQLARIHNIPLDVYPSSSVNTPSYPSGHSLQPYAIATTLSYKYPDLTNDLLKLADEIATSRLRMKLHYPSDYEYGKRLGLIIGQQIKI